MISLIPYKHFSIETSHSPDELVVLVFDLISPARYTVWETPVPNRKRFHGAVSSQGFKISIPQEMRNSFAVFMFGKFTPTEQGAKVDVCLSLHPVVIIPIGFVWCIMALGFIYSWATTGLFLGVNNEAAIPVAILGGSYLFIQFAFLFEAGELERFIRELLDEKAENKD